MYPLAVDTASAQAVFKAFVADTNDLAEKPRFYNTLTANCTNMLAHVVNEHYPNTLPYNIAWNLTGYADTYLMKQGLIQLENNSVEQTKSHANLTPHRADITEKAQLPEKEFSAFVRSLLSK